MNRLVVPALAAGLLFALGGCATIINGTSTDYQIQSEPEGANVTLSDGTRCTAPCEISLKRRYDLRVDLARDGYEPVYVLVQSRLGGAIGGSVALLSPLGTVLDAANGSSRVLYPRPLYVRLVPAGSDGTAMLLEKDGKEMSTVKEHNDKVKMDVAKTVGVKRAGLTAEEVAEFTKKHDDTEGTLVKRQQKKQKKRATTS